MENHAKIDEIKSKLDVATLVGQYVQLKRAGQNYKGLCPFHSEKSPSFMVNPKIGIYKCFGCGEGGDIFTFIENIESVDFIGALRILAEKAGVTLDRELAQKAKNDDEALYELLEQVTEFYHQLLIKSDIGKSALEYVLNGRKINAKSIREFNLGLAPGSGKELAAWADKNKVDKNLLVKLSLLSLREGRYFDWFRNRIMFPIYDSRGKVIAFSGRVLGDGEPKYLNSPESPLFNKSKTLFGLHLAKTELKKQDFAVIVEGNFDVVASFQAGVRNTVAPLGTAATERHLVEIKKWTNTVYLAFDNDKAGFNAINKLATLAFEHEMDVKVVVPSVGKDPDEAIKNSPEGWVNSVQNAQSYYDFLISKAAKTLPLNSAEGKRKFSQVIFPLLHKVANQLEQNYYIKKVASLLDEQEYIVRRMVMGGSGGTYRVPASKLVGTSPVKAQDTKVVDFLLALIFERGEYPPSLVLALVPESYVLLVQFLSKYAQFDIQQLRDQAPQELKEKIDDILLLELPDEILSDNDKIAYEIQNGIKRLKEVYLRKQLKNLSLSIKQAEISGEHGKLENLNKEFSEVALELKKVT